MSAVMGQPVHVLDAGASWFEPAVSFHGARPSADGSGTRSADGSGTGRSVLGTVCGVFRRACYLRCGERVLALCRADVAPGPLHLRIPALPALRVGDDAVLEPGRLLVGSLRIVIPPDRRWAPPPVAARDLQRPGWGRDRAWTMPVGTGLDGVLPQIRDLVAHHDLVALARLVGGRGPGLTPAGDDLLAGVLVIDALLHPGGLARRQAVARAVVTTDVAAAFLHWAARGQCIETFHRVVSAIAEGRPDLESAARAVLATTGASSGEALLLGLDLALSAPTSSVREPVPL